MGANGISKLATKQLKQIAKLDLAAVDRAAAGNERATYVVTQLPTRYVGNAVVGNTNAGGLIAGRPWIANPYGGFVAAYNMSSDDAYEIENGRISTFSNLSNNGAVMNLVNPSTADRPTLGTITSTGAPAAIFTGANEWLETQDATLSTLANSATADFEIEIACELDNVTSNQCFVIFNKVGNNQHYFYIGANTSGDLRVTRRSPSGTVNIDSTPVLILNKLHIITVNVTAGVVNVWLDGIRILNDEDIIGATGTLECDQFSIGTRNLTGPSLPMQGRIKSVGVQSL